MVAITNQAQEGSSLRAAVESLKERTSALERENKILREENQLLKKGLFGRKTEQITPGQLGMFVADEPAAEEKDPASPSKRGRKKPRGHGRGNFPEHIPRETIELDLNKEERLCPCCGKEMHAIGEDVTERGHIVPAKLFVKRYIKKKYACPDGHAVKTADAPHALIDRCKYEPSVYAYIATAKYCDHLPLHRLQGIFKRQGVHFPKQTMWDMLVVVDELVAQPVLRQMRDELLCSLILHADETPVTVCTEGAKGSRQGYVWDWRAPGMDGATKSLVQFTMTRERYGPKKMLGDWSGTLVTDGYSGYAEVVRDNRIVRAGCWVHARRKFKEALDVGTKAAALPLLHFHRLFWIERAMKKRAAERELSKMEFLELRRRVRASRSQVVVDRLYALAGEVGARRSTIPKSKLGKAITYLFGQESPLSVCLKDARIEIHNNDAERDLRHIAVGRKNWMTFASPKGGEVASRLYSLVLSCKHSGVDPEAYLEDVLVRVSTTPAREIATLTPWAWGEARPTESTTVS